MSRESVPRFSGETSSSFAFTISVPVSYPRDVIYPQFDIRFQHVEFSTRSVCYYDNFADTNFLKSTEVLHFHLRSLNLIQNLFSFFFNVLVPIFEKPLQYAASEVYQNSHDNTQLYVQNTILHTLHFYRGIFCSHLQLSSLLPSFFNLVTATFGKESDFSRLKFRIVLVIYVCRFELLSYIVSPTR